MTITASHAFASWGWSQLAISQPWGGAIQAPLLCVARLSRFKPHLVFHPSICAPDDRRIAAIRRLAGRMIFFKVDMCDRTCWA